MGRRGNNEGSITKRDDGRWMGRVTMPDDTRKTVYGKTRTEVQAKMKDLHQEAERLASLMPGSDYATLRQFFEMWLAAKYQSREGRTAATYDYYIHHYCADLFDIVPGKLTPAHIQQLYAKKGREGLGGTTLWHIHRVLHTAFEMAVKQGVLLRNPCKMVEAPRKGHKEQITWTMEEARRFLEAIKGDRFEALFVLALSTGMRQGEVFGLKWSSVDFDRGRIQVKTNLQRINHKLTVKNTKTAASTHQVLLASGTVVALRAHRVRQDEEREVMGDKWHNEHDLVFCSTIGTPVIDRNIVRRHYDPAIKRAGITEIRFHDMRHTAGTLLLEVGIHPKIVSEMLGHSSIRVTMDLYAHVTPAMHQVATTAMQTILFGDAAVLPALVAPAPTLTDAQWEALRRSIATYADSDADCLAIAAALVHEDWYTFWQRWAIAGKSQASHTLGEGATERPDER